MGSLGRLLWAHDSHDLNSDGRDNYVLRRLKNTQTVASALIKQSKRPADGLRPRTQDCEGHIFAPADPKIADYLANRKISPAIRAQSTLQRLGSLATLSMLEARCQTPCLLRRLAHVPLLLHIPLHFEAGLQFDITEDAVAGAGILVALGSCAGTKLCPFRLKLVA